MTAAAGMDPPWPWAVEKWALLANSDVDDSAFSVADRVVMATAGMHAPF